MGTSRIPYPTTVTIRHAENRTSRYPCPQTLYAWIPRISCERRMNSTKRNKSLDASFSGHHLLTQVLVRFLSFRKMTSRETFKRPSDSACQSPHPTRWILPPRSNVIQVSSTCQKPRGIMCYSSRPGRRLHLYCQRSRTKGVFLFSQIADDNWGLITRAHVHPEIASLTRAGNIAPLVLYAFDVDAKCWQSDFCTRSGNATFFSDCRQI